MKKICWIIPVIGIIIGCLVSCKSGKKMAESDANILHNNQHLLTEVIIYDVFTPPVASRIYVYSSLAAYEAIRFAQKDTKSLAANLHGFPAMPIPEKEKSYNYTLAATNAFFTVLHKLVFSIDTLKKYEEKTFGEFQESMDQAIYERSMAFGEKVGKAILERAMIDGYVKSRGKQKYLGSNEPGKWRPTPPDYLDGVEWCWNTMKPMVLDSCSQFLLPRPPKYSMDTNSTFYKQVKNVYEIGKHLTEEEKLIARYWDDNPFVIEHSGHMMFGNKKITPGGHWMGITSIASKMTQADAVKTARSYALTAIALYDGFIACWDEKYRSAVVRPVTVINENMDKSWVPFLQTPPFPEYTSAHSTITASAATVLSNQFGEKFAFQDTSDLKYIGLQRHFNSFHEAAAEASISRVYGGIHYRMSVDLGAEQGKKVGGLIVDRLLK